MIGDSEGFEIWRFKPQFDFNPVIAVNTYLMRRKWWRDHYKRHCQPADTRLLASEFGTDENWTAYETIDQLEDSIVKN
jgi:hypothetical protein